MFSLLTNERPKRFCFVFGISLLLMLSAVAALNYVVNPMAQFGTDYFVPMAQTSRLQKLTLMADLPDQPQALVLGSSRVMKLEPDYLQQLTGLSFFNAGVNYAKPEDHLAWIRYYQQRYSDFPKIVIIGIDPSSFSDMIKPDARLIATRELSKQIPEAVSWVDRARVYEELFSWDHTKKSLKSLKVQLTSKDLPTPDEHYRADGLLVYDVREKQIADGTYDLQFGIDYNKQEYFPWYLNFNKESSMRREIFRKIATLCREHDAKLIVYITPMHPKLRSYLELKTPYRERRDEVATFLKTQAAEFGFQFFDFEKIASYDGDPNQFVDGTHPLESNTRKILNIMFDVPVDPAANQTERE